jgi:hypothetical protein
VGTANSTYSAYVTQNLDTYVSMYVTTVRTAYETGSDGVISRNKYRSIVPLTNCPEGRLLTSKDKRDYIGINTFF